MKIEGLRQEALNTLKLAFTRLEYHVCGVMAKKSASPSGHEGDISDELSKVLTPKTMQDIDMIQLRAFAPPLEGLQALQQPVLGFYDSTIYIIWGVSRPGESSFTEAMAEDKFQWFSFIGHILRGKSMDEAAAAVVREQRIRREQQSIRRIEQEQSRRRRELRAEYRQQYGVF